jgi:hypothetical protein
MQHFFFKRKPFDESLKSSSDMNLGHPQLGEFFEYWHRPKEKNNASIRKFE